MIADRVGTGMNCNQDGAASLPISILILFVSTLVLIAVSRTTMMEQRISANEIRTRQAFQAAQAGIDHALAYTQGGTADRGIDRGGDGMADIISSIPLENGATYKVWYCDPTKGITPDFSPCSNAPLTCGAGFIEKPYFLMPLVLSCGWSDDGVAQQSILVNLSRASSLADAPDLPLMARGAINVQGSATIWNYFTNLTIWTGNPLVSVGDSGKTFIRNPTVPPPEGETEPPFYPGSSCKLYDDYVCVTDKVTQGLDIIDNDLTLKNMVPEVMFRNFFGVDFNTYKTGIATVTLTSAEVAGLAGAMGEAVVITGASADVSLPGGTIGSRDRPVVLIVEGNWSQDGNPIIYGMVYVMGNMDFIGSPLVHGAVYVAGSVGGTGSLDVVFDPFTLENCKGLGQSGILAGSWRDWL